MRYDYEFVFSFACAIKNLRMMAKYNHEIAAHSVMEELALRQISIESERYRELLGISDKYESECPDGLFFALCADNDLEFQLYSKESLVQPGHAYHFDRWNEDQFQQD